jgi:Tol biopolymer transport system component
MPDIYVKLIGPGEPIRLTNTPNDDERMPQWSPDGKWIAFPRAGSNAQPLAGPEHDFEGCLSGARVPRRTRLH